MMELKPLEVIKCDCGNDKWTVTEEVIRHYEAPGNRLIIGFICSQCGKKKAVTKDFKQEDK